MTGNAAPETCGLPSLSLLLIRDEQQQHSTSSQLAFSIFFPPFFEFAQLER
jgi:hypothetical protein